MINYYGYGGDMKKKIYALLLLVHIVLIVMLVIMDRFFNTEENEVMLQGQFGICEGMPTRIDEGKVFQYNSECEWTVVEVEENPVRILSGENLCVLSEDGKLYYKGLSENLESEEHSLTTEYRIHMVEKVLKINENELFLAVNKNLDYIESRVLLENGKILYQGLEDYECYIFPEETPIGLSGDYVLTEEGNIYHLYTDITNESIELEKVYEGGDIVAISACESAPCYIGLRENGQVEAWCAHYKTMAFEGWKNIVSVCQGFHYAVGLDSDGMIHFIGAEEELNVNVSQVLSTWRNIVEIAVAGEMIVGMQEDGKCLFLNISEFRSS